MNEKYIITIEAHCDAMGNSCNQIRRYAGIDRASNYPYWNPSEHDAKIFSSIDNAKRWFNENKRYLFGEYYKPFELDISALAIQKIVYEKVELLII